VSLKKIPKSYQSQKHMKPKTIQSILAAALLAPGALFAQTTATTTPVGYVTLPAIPADTDVAISIPLERPALFQGVIASVSGSTITITGANFGVLNDVELPNIVKIGSGARNGLMALISSNNATSVTIVVPEGDNLTGVAAGDKISVLPAWTPSTLFSTAPPAGTQILAFSGASPGINIGVDVTYEFDGTGWLDLGAFDSADDKAIFQGEGFLVRSPAGAGISPIVVTGQVPTANSRIVLNNLSPGVGQDNVVSFVGAVGEIIGNSGLSAIASAGDQLLVLDNSVAGINKGYSTTLEYDGSGWQDIGLFEDVTTTFKLEPGVGYTFRRSAASSADNLIWTDRPEYVPAP
jgi:uncharacterized protein (TIGR02597 family)